MSDSSSRLPNGARSLPTASFALRPEQVDQIRKLAVQRNTSQSAIMREAVDLYMRDTIRQALEQLQNAPRGEGNPLFADPAPTPSTREPMRGSTWPKAGR